MEKRVMSRFFSPKNTFDPSDPDYLKVSRVQNDLKYHAEERPVSNLKNTKKILYSITLAKIYNKLTDLYNYITNRHTCAKKDLISNIELLQKLFIQLKMTNYSKSVNYINKLSNCWNNINTILEDLESLHTSAINASNALESLLTTIGEYKSSTEYNLGYYLSHHAGEQWLPFPLIEILNKLYTDNLLRKEKSTLHSFVAELGSILEKNLSKKEK